MPRKVLVLAAATAVAIAALALPYWMGIRVEREVRALVREAGRAGPFRLRIVDYERGWFSSRARIRVTLTPPPGPALALPQFGFDLDERIEHGPYPVAGRRDGVAPVLAVIHSVLIGDAKSGFGTGSGLPAKPLEAVTVVYLSGRSDTDVRMPAWRLTGTGRGVGPLRAAPYGAQRVVWGGLRGRVGWSADFGRVTERFTAPGLEIDGPVAFVRLRDVSLEGHSRRAPSGLMQGEMTLRAASLDAAATGSKRTSLSVTGLDLHSAGAEHDGAMTVRMAMRARTIRAGAIEVGPLIYELRIARLDTDAVVRLQKAMRRLRDQVADPAALRRRFAGQMLAILPDLLRRSPEIVLDLSLRTGAGPVLLRGRVKLPASVTPGPDAWKRLVGDAELRVPTTVLRAVLVTRARSQLLAARGKGAVQRLDPAQIVRVATLMGRQRMQSLKARGLLECDGGECRAVLRYDSGRLTVNGRTLLRAPGAAR
ncbi:hypothetical protein BMS3Bbin12_00503 [bacterium BMS3Bbin12]|nr:hypothetical protein BMS3Abin12_00610 [bacterium BMS3Abin12]GBE47344.1 hypothetical protein BMS3Bbin12_00503 [bacterium BMS3Bbin12]GBE50350.1 hypothetical protein BMS3Bbin13_01289 [bacterium BMS3Bbin13]HDJ85862.1 DUF945 domain-containing protein [Chromatiales bacterium]HDK03751.1 DUF945 domain-containing protein [Gammaproteobacteria bacterium]